MATSTTQLQAFQNAAGHGGVMQDAGGEIIVKPCTQAEIDFYQQTLVSHPDFAAFMPTFMGTLALGDHASAMLPKPEDTKEQVSTASVKKLKTETAIVLENVEHGYQHPNVVDLKLGAKLYAPGTETEKAARLDKVASETTSGSLNFRIAGMKVWNTEHSKFDIYDKQYGRTFSAETVSEAFTTFFKTLASTDTTRSLLKDIAAELARISATLESSESRFFSASVLLVYEGDPEALATLSRPQVDSLTSKSTEHASSEQASEASSDSEEEHEHLSPFRLKMIDFAHSTWCQGEGHDENVIKGLRSIEGQLALLIAKNS